MALPNVSEKHECAQSVTLVEINEGLHADIEKLTAAVAFHRADAEEWKKLYQDTKVQLAEQVQAQR